MPDISNETLDEVERERASWDAKFGAIIKRARRGERNLQLAAATAFGAEAALRRLSARLREERRK